MIQETKQRWTVPSSWVWTNLSQLGDIVAGGTPSTKDRSYWGDRINWITPADLTGYSAKTIKRGAKGISEIGLARSSAKVMPAGSVHFSSRAPIGYVVISSEPLATNQGFKSLVPAQGIFNEYVYYYLMASRDYASRYASGTTFLELSGKAFGNLLIPLAPKVTQHRIVEKIEELFSELDKGVESLKAARAKLHVYRQAVLKHAFEGKLTAQWREENNDMLETAKQFHAHIKKDCKVHNQAEVEEWKGTDTNWQMGRKDSYRPNKPREMSNLVTFAAKKNDAAPKNWLSLKIEDVCEIIDGDRGTNYPKKDDYLPSGYCLFLNAKNVTKNGFVFDECQFINEEKHQSLRKGTVEVGDIIFTSRGTIGNVAFHSSAREFRAIRINSGMFILRNYSPIMKGDYFTWLLMSPIIIQQIKRLNSGTAQPQLPIREFKQFVTPVPPIPEQEQIVRTIVAQMSIIEMIVGDLSGQLRSADVLRQSILKKAFAGQLVPQDPNDEPASELLNRITEEKSRRDTAIKVATKKASPLECKIRHNKILISK